MKQQKLFDNRCYLKIKCYNFCHKEGLLRTHRLRIFKIKRNRSLLAVNTTIPTKFVVSKPQITLTHPLHGILISLHNIADNTYLEI